MVDESTGNPQGAKADRPLPNCKALLVCERVIIERETDRPTVVGVFHDLHLREIPGETPPFWVFLQLVDGIGEYDLALELHDLLDGDLIGRGGIGQAAFDARPARQYFAVPVQPVKIPHAGTYDVVLLADGRELERQQIEVFLLDEEVTHGEEAT